MTIVHIITLLVAGIGVGFAGGLLGVGSALIMTPVQYVVHVTMGIPTDMSIKLAFGTSALVILPIAGSSTWRHSKKRSSVVESSHYLRWPPTTASKATSIYLSL